MDGAWTGAADSFAAVQHVAVAEANEACERTFVSKRLLVIFARAVRKARERVGLTQPVFAERFHITLSRLRDWERARYKPDTVAAAYIKAILHNPRAVQRALAVKD